MMSHHSSKIYFVRFLYFCVIAFELPKFPFIISACLSSSHEPYYLLPQFLGTVASRSSPYWIFLHSLILNVLVVAIGLKMLGYDIRQRVIDFLFIVSALFVLPSINHFGRAPDMAAVSVNLAALVVISLLFLYRQGFAFLVTISFPLWAFDAPAFLYYVYQIITGGFDSRITLFLIQFMTSDTFYPAYLKMFIFLLSTAGMIGATFVFVTIPEKKTE